MNNTFILGQITGQIPAGPASPNLWVYGAEIVKVLYGPWPIASIPLFPKTEERFPKTEDSLLFPGLIYNGFRMMGHYEGKEVTFTPNSWRLLRFLEYCGGRACRDEAIGNCWPEGSNPSVLYNAASVTSVAIEALLGVSDAIVFEGGEVFAAV